ncbi:MAG: four helix bundle protein [Candidatus Marinimicrobia bacterium]|nr:four helix bundle protein [Candidatus Neomarinimicrobiota bacterium]
MNVIQRGKQKARELVKEVYDISNRGRLSKNYKLRDQIRSAAVSAMSNIAEGFARFHRKEFIRFLDISQSSCSEVKSLLYVILDQSYIPSNQVKKIQEKVDETRNITLGLLKYVNETVKARQDVVREPFSTYKIAGDIPKWIEIPGEFINTLTHEYSNTCSKDAARTAENQNTRMLIKRIPNLRDEYNL